MNVDNIKQQKTIDSLVLYQKTTDSLLAIVLNCCTQGATHRINNTNGDQNTKEKTLQIQLANNMVLYQNEPNPFGESTVIRYFIPENITSNVFIVFNDMFGNEIKKVEITTKGFGNINANSENLASGIYSYSLIVNGNVIDTKKMIRN